eukprot:998516-Prymnesium_polylepis.2
MSVRRADVVGGKTATSTSGTPTSRLAAVMGVGHARWREQRTEGELVPAGLLDHREYRELVETHMQSPCSNTGCSICQRKLEKSDKSDKTSVLTIKK